MKYPRFISFIKFMPLLALLFFLNSCDEEASVTRIFEASFQTNTLGLGGLNESVDVTVDFSTPTLTATTVQVDVTENGLVYGSHYTATDYTNGVIAVEIPAGSSSATFSVTRLVEFINTGNSIDLTLTAIEGEDEADILGFTSLSILFEELVSDGGTIDLQTGGSTMPNQCYIDLSNFSQTAVRRDTWELAFYSGSENRVFINSSLLVAAAGLQGYSDLSIVNSDLVFEEALTFTRLNPQTFASEEVEVSNVSELLEGIDVTYSQYGPDAFTDSKEGNIDETAIAEVSSTEDENQVYIVSLGNEIPATTDGALNTTGDQRGYYKIRILLEGDNYKLQYAELDATTFEEVVIAKNTNYNHVFYSLSNEEEVSVEPGLSSWDINFSGVFSYYGAFGGSLAGLTFTDYALHNTLGGTGLYEILTYTTDENGIVTENDVPAYENFTSSDIVESSFVYDNRAVIGSSWRSVFGGPPAAKDDRYYIIKDSDGNYFKLMFTGLTSDTGERGYAQFTYAVL